MADQRIVLRYVIFRRAQVPPTLVLGRAQPIPRLHAGLEGSLACRGPPRPSLRIQRHLTKKDIRVPSLILHERRGVIVPTVAPRHLQLVSASSHHDAVAPHCQRRVHEQSHGRALGVNEWQAGVEHAAVVANDDGNVRVGIMHGQHGDTHEHRRKHKGNGKAASRVFAPTALHRLLHNGGNDHRTAHGEDEEEREVDLATVGPHTVADELEDVHCIRVILQEVEPCRKLCNAADRHARQARQAE
mmetsp:Transcript_156631/g.499876  ORF Transcript_156631/g.499876 Transcript_156631/m.499876 type:complete len:244 (-) Transcript_156631:517-1248(-)